ncbi:MAG TPA: hypothetical protein DF712_19755 [Balneola sp.]|nr:hypothetical protein [Bacteroidota bacterium]MAC05620.1 hypothetical protein [Balneola sp.]HBZ39566.1 hypothetical protein [Balneola sp.]HCT54685.1 hypothetical protein [Balneola sp.]|tara:strand:+ start:1897 stop:2508 length:612 start_codon:yes stop_codon:yes gene_type:complete
MKQSFLLFLFLTICISFTSETAEAQFKEYTGSGDDILVIEKPDEDMPALLVINGNRGSNHFSVTSFDASRDRIDLLVNTTEPYSGIVAVDLPVGTNTKMLEISASGSWAINVYPIGAAHKISTDNPKSDSGDNILWIEGDASIATISGNSNSSHFSVTAYDGSGRRNGLLVNTTDRYNGKVMIPKGTLLLQVTASGNWSVKLQ